MLGSSGVSIAGGGIDGGIADRSDELFSHIVCLETKPRPSATIVADRLERYVLLTPEQPVVATEASICEAFGVGRRVARQSCRLLQQRGVVQLRRGGGGSGGVCRMLPTAQDAAQTLALSVGPLSGTTDWVDVERALAGIRTGAVPLIVPFARDVVSSARRPAAAPGGIENNAAMQLAASLQLEIELGGGPAADGGLGSLDAICLRHETSHEVAVAAVRLLQDRQMVTLRRGRCGGVVPLAGGAAQAIRKANAYFIGAGITVDECEELLRAINIAMIDLACVRATERDRSRIQHALAVMEGVDRASDIGVAWYLLQRAIADAAHSELLHVLARSLAGSILLRRVRARDLPSSAARELLVTSQLIVGNVAAGRTERSAPAHHRCLAALRDSW